MDDLTFSMWTTRDLGTPEGVQKFLDALKMWGAPWLPGKFGEYEPLRRDFAREGPTGFAEAWLGSDPGGGDLLFRFSRAIRGRGAIHWARRPHHRFNILSLSLDAASAGDARADELSGVGRALFNVFDGAYGRIYSEADFKSQHFDASSRQLRGQSFGQHIPGLYWANFFGTVLVEFLGAERVATCPCTRREALPDGRCMLVFGDRPWQWDDPAVRSLKESARRHLGSQALFDLRHPDRPTRSPAYDFSEVQVLSASSPSKSEDAIEGFFTDSAGAQEFLRSIPLLAGSLGRRLGASLDLSVSSLAAIDRAIARSSDARRVPDREDVLAVAAYFGEVLRRTIGGEWSLDDKDPRMPVLRLPSGETEYPVIRAMKLFADGSRLSDWYDFLRRGGAGLLRHR